MPRKYLLFFIGALILPALTACLSIFGTRLGSDMPLDTSGTLTCSTECMNRGQCGTAADESLYILGGLDAPAVTNHNRVFPDTTPVQIISSRVENMQTADAQPFSLTFYQVTTEDLTKAGWVAGWCIASR